MPDNPNNEVTTLDLVEAVHIISILAPELGSEEIAAHLRQQLQLPVKSEFVADVLSGVATAQAKD